MGWWQNVDWLYVRDAFWWGVNKAERRRRQREVQDELAWQAMRGAMTQAAYRAYRAILGKGKQETQYVDDEWRVQVRPNYSDSHDRYTTDFIITPRDGSGDRLHVVIDQYGNEIVNEWHYKNPS